MPPTHNILIAEDEPLSREFMTMLLTHAGHHVLAARDGNEARQILRDHPIDLALLDVRMPGENGMEICRGVKSNPATSLIPVVLMTGYDTEDERLRGIDAGADDFFIKPLRKQDLLARVRSLLRFRDQVNQLEEAETVLVTLALSIEAKDPYTEGHCERLSRYAVALGRRLGLPEAQLIALRRGGSVHDIGKIAVPEAILQKPGPLTPEEWATMKLHPVSGEKICAPLRSFALVLPIIRHHHEKMDGSGYPDGLVGENIPLIARILTTVDVYDALTTDRPYRAALSAEAAFETMLSEVRRGWWDVNLVELFFEITAKLTEDTSTNPLMPRWTPGTQRRLPLESNRDRFLSCPERNI